jgi:hypothetical protein
LNKDLGSGLSRHANAVRTSRLARGQVANPRSQEPVGQRPANARGKDCVVPLALSEEDPPRPAGRLERGTAASDPTTTGTTSGVRYVPASAEGNDAVLFCGFTPFDIEAECAVLRVIDMEAGVVREHSGDVIDPTDK